MSLSRKKSKGCLTDQMFESAMYGRMQEVMEGNREKGCLLLRGETSSWGGHSRREIGKRGECLHPRRDKGQLRTVAGTRPELASGREETGSEEKRVGRFGQMR